MLLLFPAAVLVMLVLAAIAVDLSAAFLAQRELADATAAAANDAATLALSDRDFYRAGHVSLDAAALQQIAEQRISMVLDVRRHQHLTIQAEPIEPATAGCHWAVRVSASSSVRYVFAPAIPGGPDEALLQASSIARPQDQELRSSGC
ncbi:MAG: hypothetical protein ACRD0Q_07715 [Acidimicrobiales bacterium]